MILSVQSDCSDTDFAAKLIDVHSDGARHAVDGPCDPRDDRDPSGEPRHLAPERVERLTINFGHIWHTFAAGHRLEVHLTSSNFPGRVSQYQERPSNTGER